MSFRTLRRMSENVCIMTTGADILPSAFFVQSVDLDLRQSFYRRFPKTRESYDKQKEEEIVAITSTSRKWQRVGKPFFRRDAATGIVFRRALPSRLYPTGRITVCVPYELSFNVAVCKQHPCLIHTSFLMAKLTTGSRTPRVTRPVLTRREAEQHRLRNRCEVHGS